MELLVASDESLLWDLARVRNKRFMVVSHVKCLQHKRTWGGCIRYELVCRSQQQCVEQCRMSGQMRNLRPWVIFHYTLLGMVLYYPKESGFENCFQTNDLVSREA